MDNGGQGSEKRIYLATEVKGLADGIASAVRASGGSIGEWTFFYLPLSVFFFFVVCSLTNAVFFLVYGLYSRLNTRRELTSLSIYI